MSSSRTNRRKVAQDNLQIFEQGYYITPKSVRVSIKKDLQTAKENVIVYKPDSYESIIQDLNPEELLSQETKFFVENFTTLEACKDLLKENYEKVFALNFASAKNPGGGFLNGSQAQEESLARASCLYPCLLKGREMYDYNRKNTNTLYSNYAIYTPDVPVFRNDNDELLDNSYKVSFFTSPAVNRGALNKKLHSKIDEVMLQRTANLLAVALSKGYKTMVLGAWGCGVFRNVPEDIANYFKVQLLENELFVNKFEKVIFAIYSKSEESKNFRAFQKVFG